MSSAELGGFDARATYDTASAHYLDASRDFWLRVSERTVDLVEPRPGDRVLDVTCGPGWSAIAAAQRVAPDGRVVAVDYAPQMLALAQRQADLAGIQGIEWRQVDMTQLDERGAYDVVICVLGLFFVEDMTAQVRRFLGLLQPGGRLGIGALGKRVFTPLVDDFRRDVADLRPDLDWVVPWERLNDRDRFHQVLSEAGADRIEFVEEENPAPLHQPEDWWRMVLGSGLRRYVMELGPEAAESVRQRHMALIQDEGIASVDLDILVATCQAA